MMPANHVLSLTPARRAAYERDGFVLVDGVFGRDDLEAVNGDLDRHIAAGGAGAMSDGSRRGWVMALGLATPLARQMVRDERILDLIAPLVHPGIAIYSAKLVTKEPFDPTVCHWHQDDAYYVRHSLSRCRLSAYIALQDIRAEQGCLQVIPGSHRAGLKPTVLRPTGTCGVSLAEPPDLSQARHVPMKAGDVLIFSALLHHGSQGNPTPDRRRAFIVSYQEANTPALSGSPTPGNADQWEVLRPA